MDYFTKTLKPLTLFCVGGWVYTFIEILWRGYTHWTMFFLGGICFVILGLINEIFSWTLGFVWQCLIGATAITVCEFIAGLVLNVWLGMGVWDYSNVPLNLLGQICLPYFLLWIPLSAVGIVLDDILRWRWFGEERPQYKWV